MVPTNLLLLNIKKTNFMQFSLKPNQRTDDLLGYRANFILNTNSTSFLGLTLDSSLSWNLHIEQICNKPNSACYIIRSLRPIISTQNLRTIYFSYVHSIITHGIIFWANSSNSNTIIKLQKRAIRIIMNARNMVSCCELFKKLNVLPLHSQYILAQMCC